jgi:type VI protein secretion system component VasA
MFVVLYPHYLHPLPSQSALQVVPLAACNLVILASGVQAPEGLSEAVHIVPEAWLLEAAETQLCPELRWRPAA